MFNLVFLRCSFYWTMAPYLKVLLVPFELPRAVVIKISPNSKKLQSENHPLSLFLKISKPDILPFAPIFAFHPVWKCKRSREVIGISVSQFTGKCGEKKPQKTRHSVEFNHVRFDFLKKSWLKLENKLLELSSSICCSLKCPQLDKFGPINRITYYSLVSSLGCAVRQNDFCKPYFITDQLSECFFYKVGLIIVSLS